MNMLPPLPYHRSIKEYFKKYEPEVYSWYERAESKSDYADAMRLELLKTSYRLEPASHPSLYSIAAEVLESMNLSETPLTIYKSNEESGAALFFAPDEIHICLYGDILQRLDQQELKAVLAHEAGHFQLFSEESSSYLVCSRILIAAATQADLDNAHFESCRRFSLMSEIYCDRNAYEVCQSTESIITSLVKLQTGMNKVDAGAYLRQVDDIMKSGKIESEEMTHPEIYIRCAALRMYKEDPQTADERIYKLISSSLAINHLDLIGQLTLSSLTEEFIAELLKPKMFEDETLQAQAGLYSNEEIEVNKELGFDWQQIDEETVNYFISLIFDFSFINPDLRDAVLCHANNLCIEKGWNRVLEKRLSEDFKYSKAKVKKIFSSFSKVEFS